MAFIYVLTSNYKAVPKGTENYTNHFAYIPIHNFRIPTNTHHIRIHTYMKTFLMKKFRLPVPELLPLFVNEFS